MPDSGFSCPALPLMLTAALSYIAAVMPIVRDEGTETQRGSVNYSLEILWLADGGAGPGGWLQSLCP